MKPALTFSFLLLTIVSTSVNANECCLCDQCKSIPEEKRDMVLLDLNQTCAEVEVELLKHQDNDDGKCSLNKKLYSQHCCSKGFDIVLSSEEPPTSSSYLGRAARDLWSSSWTASTTTTATTSTINTRTATKSATTNSNWCADNRYASNDVEFNTPGGACVCPVCKSGDDPTGAWGGTVHVPGKGQYSGTCTYLNQIGACVHLIIRGILCRFQKRPYI